MSIPARPWGRFLGGAKILPRTSLCSGGEDRSTLNGWDGVRDAIAVNALPGSNSEHPRKSPLGNYRSIKLWAEDPERCDAAGIPAERGFKTKPELAIDMLEKALDAGVPARWVTGDAVYGQYYKLRKALEDRGVFYVLAVPMNQLF